jgi:DnaJ like chaperone protein
MLAFTFAAMGRIARAGGRVQACHIAQAERLMNQMGFSARHRRLAIEWFEAGKTNSFDFAATAIGCPRAEDAPLLRRLSLECMLLMAWANGPPSAAERTAFDQLAALLGADPAARQAAETVVKAHREQALPPPLREAYATLAVEPWIDDAALTLAYRRLLSRHHPDKFVATSNAQAVADARLRTIAIRHAYEFIRASRSAG